MMWLPLEDHLLHWAMLRSSKIKMLVPLWGCLLVLGSCLQPKSGFRAVDHGEVFSLSGFSITPPSGPGWSLMNRDTRLQEASPLPVETEMESFLKSVVFTPLPNPERLRKPTPPQQAWLAKMDLQGEILWRRDYPEASGIGSLQPGKDGRIIAAGSWGGHYKTAGKPWVALLDPDGRILREHRFEGAGRDIPTALEAPDGGLLIIGEFLAEGNTGSYDVYLKKISPQGSEEWKKRYGWEGVESHNRAIPVRSGGCLVAGQCWSKGGPPRGWIFKVNPTGSRNGPPFWQKRKTRTPIPWRSSRTTALWWPWNLSSPTAAPG